MSPYSYENTGTTISQEPFDIAKVIKNFKNPSISSENVEELSRDGRANERKALQDKIIGWLTDENIDWAEGKNIGEVIRRFGNTPEPIAILPSIVRRNIPSLDGDYLYCGKAYLINHHANHHPEIDVNEYLNIQTILDSYDDIKDLSEGGNLKIAFVKKLNKGYAVVAELSKEYDKIVLHKTFFYRDAAGKRVPYKNKPSILKKWSEDGSTSISPAKSKQPADTENISALDHSSAGKVTEKENSVQTSIANAEAETDTDPSEAQKKAGNYKKGHVKIDGFDVTIENPKGSMRRGTDADGKQWEQEMHNTYGYILGTEGVDGDHIDVFLSDNPANGDVFVVDQVNKDGTFDEHKVMYGFASEEEARNAYLSNYEDGWTGLGAITRVSKEEFKKWVDSSHRKTKPFAEYKGVKKTDIPGETDIPGSNAGKMQKADGVKPVTKQEAAMRDALVDVLRGAGVEVVTDAEEGQRVLDEENDEVKMQAKKEHLKPRPLPQKKNINQQSFQVLTVQKYLIILIS